MPDLITFRAHRLPAADLASAMLRGDEDEIARLYDRAISFGGTFGSVVESIDRGIFRALARLQVQVLDELRAELMKQAGPKAAALVVRFDEGPKGWTAAIPGLAEAHGATKAAAAKALGKAAGKAIADMIAEAAG